MNRQKIMMKQPSKIASFRFGTFLLVFFLLTAFSAEAQLGRFRKVIYKITPREGLSNFFSLTLYLIDRNGESVTVSPGANIVKWDYFKFKSEDGVKISYGTGTFPILRDLNGKDSLKVTVTCPNPDLNSEFYVSAKYCKSVVLDAHEIPYGGTADERWEMVMNDGSRYPIDSLWVNLGTLKNESDPVISRENGKLRMNTRDLIPGAQLRFRDTKSGNLIVDQQLRVAYSGQTDFDFSGLPGRDGRNGVTARIASEMGDNGENGENGLDAESVTVFIRPGTGDSEGFYEVIAVGGNHRKQTFILPAAATVNIHARGGKGGDGGKGGAGASSAAVEATAHSRSPGIGGHGGLGGYGGDGGDVVVIIADALKDAPITVHVKNDGGAGGNGGKKGNDGRDLNITPIERAFSRNDPPPVLPTAASGYSGRSGTYFGTRYVSVEEFDQLLREAGWK